MKLTGRFRALLLAVLLSTTLLPGCGTSTSKNSVPTTEEVFYSHSVLFDNHSTLRASGYNGYGQLGNGTLDNAIFFLPVVGKDLPKLRGYAAGANHTIAFGNNSTVYAWGCNFQGRLGLTFPPTSGSKAFSSLAFQVEHFTEAVQQVAAGWMHSMALVGGKVYAWGGNTWGQLGNGTYITTILPTLVADVGGGAGSTLSGISQIAAGGGHSLALKFNNVSTSTVYGWGYNQFGQVGAEGLFFPTPVVSFGPWNDRSSSPHTVVTDIAAAGSYSLALVKEYHGQATIDDLKSETGTVWGWGYDNYGQLAQNHLDLVAVPRPVQVQMHDKTPLTNVRKVSPGTLHVIAMVDTVDGKGAVWAWGFNEKAQLGTGANSLFIAYATPATAVNDLIARSQHGVSDVYAFGNQSFAKIDGVWYGWGDNSWGQLGQPVPTNSIAFLLQPVRIF